MLCFLSKFSCPFLPQLELVGKPSVLPRLPQSPSPIRPDPWALSQFPKFVDTVWKQDLHLYSMLEKKKVKATSPVLLTQGFCQQNVFVRCEWIFFFFYSFIIFLLAHV